MYKYLLFDLDGTLSDPGIGITNSVMHALEKRGIHVENRETLFPFIGPPLAESFNRYYGFSPDECVSAIADYREYFSVKGLFENEIYPETVKTLSTLKENGFKLIVATSKPEPFTIEILKHFGILEYFDFVAGALFNETRTRKGEVIAWALENIAPASPSEVIMIGDREHDVIGAKQNGIDCIGVLWGYGSREELEAAGAGYIAESMADIIRVCL